MATPARSSGPSERHRRASADHQASPLCGTSRSSPRTSPCPWRSVSPGSSPRSRGHLGRRGCPAWVDRRWLRPVVGVGRRRRRGGGVDAVLAGRALSLGRVPGHPDLLAAERRLADGPPGASDVAAGAGRAVRPVHLGKPGGRAALRRGLHVGHRPLDHPARLRREHGHARAPSRTSWPAARRRPASPPYLGRSGIDYVVERNDLDLASTAAIPPAQVHQVLSQTPGLVRVAGFGPFIPKSRRRRATYRTTTRRVPSISARSRSGPSRLPSRRCRRFRRSNPLVVSGSNSSLLPLAGSGVLHGRAAVLATDPDSTRAAASPGATLAITDGNPAPGGVVRQDRPERHPTCSSPGQRFGRTATVPPDYSSNPTEPPPRPWPLPIGGARSPLVVRLDPTARHPLAGSGVRIRRGSGDCVGGVDSPATRWASGSVSDSAIRRRPDRSPSPRSTTRRPARGSKRCSSPPTGGRPRTIPKGSAPVDRGRCARHDEPVSPFRIIKVWKSDSHYLPGSRHHRRGHSRCDIPSGHASSHGRRRGVLRTQVRTRRSSASPTRSTTRTSTSPDRRPRRHRSPGSSSSRRRWRWRSPGRRSLSPAPPLDRPVSATAATPVDQPLQIAASSWLRDLPRYRAENLVEAGHRPPGSPGSAIPPHR